MTRNHLPMRALTCVLTLLLAASAATAHPGPRVWVGSAGGKVATFTSDNDLSPSSFSASRVFVGGGDEDSLQPDGLLKELFAGGGIYTTTFPGYQVRTDGLGGVASGAQVGFSLAGPLLAFDAANHRFLTSQQVYGTPGPAPQMGLSIGSSLVITGTGEKPGFALFDYTSGDAHGHPSMTLYGNGTSPSDGPQGIYAVPMRVTVSGLTASDPYYILLGRGIDVSQPTFQDAITVARTTLVPEPATVGVMAVGAVALLARRRRVSK